MLGQFVDIVTKRANCTNFLVVALDNATGAFLAPRGVPHYVKQLTSKDGQDSSKTVSPLAPRPSPLAPRPSPLAPRRRPRSPLAFAAAALSPRH